MQLSTQSNSSLGSILRIKYFASQYFITMCLNSDFSGIPSCDILRMKNSIVILELFISRVWCFILIMYRSYLGNFTWGKQTFQLRNFRVIHWQLWLWNSSVLSLAPKAYGASRITALFGIYFIFPRNVYKWHPHKKYREKDPSEFTPHTSLNRKVYLILPLSFFKFWDT